MKILRKEKKKFFIFLIAILSLVIISYYNGSFAMKTYQEVDFTTGLVTASTLNVRNGPGLGHKITSKIHKNEYVRVFAKIDNWYVIQTDKDIVGVVFADYIKPIYPETYETNTEESREIEQEDDSENMNEQTENEVNEITNRENIQVSNKEYSSELTEDEQFVFDKINEKRVEAGLEPLKIDDDLQNVCRIKAQDMVEKEYFAHNSPEFGSPFDMIKSNGIKYKVAGENIAGNADSNKAVEAWMNSENHKANIINKNYNYTGVSVVNSPKYGKIYVQMFIGR